MKDPSSFKVQEAKVVLDTVPLFLNRKILSSSQDVLKAIEEKERYKNRDSYYWRDEKERAEAQLNKAFLAFNAEHQALKKEKRQTHYLVLIECSGNNSYGTSVSSRYVVIVDKDNTDKVLGEYHLDSDFVTKALSAYMMTGNKRLKTNEFGKIETDGLTEVEKFVFADE